MLRVHIAIDTGMHRLGIPWDDEGTILSVFSLNRLVVTGSFTHLAASDTADIHATAFTQRQMERFAELITRITDAGIDCPRTHILASYGILRYANDSGNLVRPGIALYGVLSTKSDTAIWKDKLCPVMTLKARITEIRELDTGDHAGYGTEFTAKHPMRVAWLAAGYADGVPRALSNGVGAVLIAGKKAVVVGRICMDQMMVDVTHISDVNVGDTAVLIGRSHGDEISVCVSNLSHE